ncbi:MAG: peptidase M48 [Cellvibrionales bacterium TMED79]|jgi:STE24 endopeptidase|nr:peptidase M48 [Halieaceae bacterium]OUV01359.1 MAG: peptidase M48 [Cellvibrionales bacterium TMED79]
MAFDAVSATNAYIDSLGTEALAQAAAYTAGNHWLILWSLLATVVSTSLIVRSGILVALSNKLSQRGAFNRAFRVSAAFIVLSAIIELPWTIYTSWYRQTQYDMTTQPLGDFLGQSGLGLALSAVLMGLLLATFYVLIKKAGQLWWAWFGGITASLVATMMLLGPSLIQPLFNEYTPVPEGEVKEAIEALALEANIPTNRIFMYDGSRQSNNFTANVSGIGSSARIAISDIALKEANLDEVKAVTGHEIGHYVSGHIWWVVFLLSGEVVIAFLLADRLFKPVARVFGADENIQNPASVPILILLVGVLLTLFEPINNSLTRMNEADADRYSLENVGLPDGLASALVKTAEYRDPRPGQLQELLFYTHPSVESRVRMAMEWKGEQLATELLPEN